MGKRSDFERIDNDLYPTPLKGVLPLLPLLKAEGFRTFAEPCGEPNSILVQTLESHGFKCVYAGDKRTGQDALARTNYNDCERIITNPPHKREWLHPLIEHLASVAPSWLLIDSDWWHTRQSAPFSHLCTTIVPVGRLKWVEGTDNTGKDNFCWYRFDAKHKRPTIIHGRTP
jgi:hypothetical protein